MQRFIEEEDKELIEEDYTFCRTAEQKRKHNEFAKKYMEKTSTHFLEISPSTGRRRTELYKHTQPDDGDWTGHVPFEYGPEVKLPQTERKNEKQSVLSEHSIREMSIFRKKDKALIKKREESKERVLIQEKSHKYVNPFARRKQNQAEDRSKPFKKTNNEEQKERNNQSRSPSKAMPSNLNVSRSKEDAEYRRKLTIVQQARRYDAEKNARNEEKRRMRQLYSQKRSESND